MRRLGMAVVALAFAACGAQQSAEPADVQVKPDDPAIHYSGRRELSVTGPQFSLAGSSLHVRFTGTKLKVKLRETSGAPDEWNNFYDVRIDGALTQVLETKNGEAEYTLASGLPAGEHEAELFKRTEPWIGETQVLGLVLDPGASLSPVTTPDRRIEFVGDSITVGLGIEGESEACDYSAKLQNHAESFANLISEKLGAEHVAMAASGVGVVVDWQGGTTTLMGDIYDRALIERASSRWSFDWKPQAVVVNLGTTDFTKGDPGEAAFVQRYGELLQKIRTVYPGAVIFAVVGPMLRDGYPIGVNSLQLARSYVQTAVANRKAAGDANVEFVELTQDDGSRGFGCDYHPNKVTHALMAEQLLPVIKARLGW